MVVRFDLKSSIDCCEVVDWLQQILVMQSHQVRGLIDANEFLYKPELEEQQILLFYMHASIYMLHISITDALKGFRFCLVHLWVCSLVPIT